MQKQRLIYNFMITNDFDVLCLQEVCFDDFNFNNANYQFIVNRPGDVGGTAFLLKRTTPVKNIIRATNGRILTAEVGQIKLINVYAPAGRLNCPERIDFFKNQLPRHLTGKNTVMLGDFNAVIHKFDRFEKGSQTGKRNQFLAAVVEAHQFVDVWLDRNAKGSGHTLLYPNGSSRIDQVYATPNLKHLCTATELLQVAFSDHACVKVHIEASFLRSNQKQTRKLWKMNTAVLEEAEFRKTLNHFIFSARQHPLWASHRVVWWEDVFKLGIKKITVDYCRRRMQWKHCTADFYRTCLDEGARSATQSAEALKHYRLLQRSFEDWEIKEGRGVVVRSRSSTTTQDEIPSAYHAAREHKSKKATVISKLMSTAGKQLNSPEEIAEEVEASYATQFATPVTGDSGLDCLVLHHLNGVEVPSHLAKDLSKPIDSMEAKQVLDTLKTNKSPGVDGIPAELYKAIWDEIQVDVITVFNEILNTSCLTQSQKQGYVKLIPKTKSPVNIGDYRPISLLCVDYKWLAAILAKRLVRTLPYVLADSQRGGLPNRKAEDVLALVRDVMILAEEKQIQGAIATLDFSKAFDRVSRPVIWKVLDKLGFPPNFTAMLKGLYVDVQAVIDVGEAQTKPIKCENSVRQGCPLSVPLYLIYIEPLLRMLKKRLRGIDSFKASAKTAGFVDDVTLFLKNNVDIHAAGGTIEQFCRWTGARLNRKKTNIMFLGTWRAKPRSIPWAQEAKELNILGITFQQTIEETVKKQWAKTHQLTVSKYKDYSTRTLTIHQKARLIKTHVLSKCTHVARILPCPSQIAHRVLTNTRFFLWRGQLEKTEAKVLYQSEENGGIRLPHPASVFKALFIRANLDMMPRYGGVGFEFSADLAEYWTGLRLRGIVNEEPSRLRPYNYLGGNVVIESLIRAVKEAANLGLSMRNQRLPAVKIFYWTLVRPHLQRSPIEAELPHMAWDSAWKNLKRLPPKTRELMYKLNQNILPVKARLHRIKFAQNAECPLCGDANEDVNHAFITCPSHEHVLREMKAKVLPPDLRSTPDEHLIRLAINPSRITTKTTQRVAAMLEQIWLARCSGRTLTRIEMNAVLN